MTRRRGAVLVAAVALLLALWPISVRAHADPGSWVYEALEQLKTAGLVPLWVGVRRPMSLADLREAVQEAEARAARRAVTPAQRRLIERLRRALGPGEEVSLGPGLTVVTPDGIYGVVFGYGTIIGASGPVEYSLGASTRLPANVLSLRYTAGHVSFLAGRDRIGWGPAGTGGLLFSESAGGLNRAEFDLTWGGFRFAKIVALLDDGRSIVGTRLDITRPNFRLGLGDAVLLPGAPFWGYIADPIPILANRYISQLRDAAGFTDNYLAMVDGEWLVTPGWRLFGELLVDDLQVISPTARYPSRLGGTVGIDTTEIPGIESARLFYTRVYNWTYSATDPRLHYLHRGLPLAHPLGADFDLLQLRVQPHLDGLTYWATVIRKGEGRVGRIWMNQTEANRFRFLMGTVEYSAILGLDAPFSTGGATVVAGPWIAYRRNADHVGGARRFDLGFNITIQIVR